MVAECSNPGRIVGCVKFRRGNVPAPTDNEKPVAVTETGTRLRPATGRVLRISRFSYFLSSFTWATFACRPASETAFMKAAALFGVEALPERMSWNFMSLP